MGKCKVSLNTWCNGKDRKPCQFRSQAAGAYGTNKFEGKIVKMCQECRKAYTGDFKILKQ